MANNNILPFCPTDIGTNLLTQLQYSTATDRTNGNQPGLASSKLINKAMRQSAFVSSQFAQWVSNKLTQDVLDNGDTAALLAQISSALAQNIGINNLSFNTSVAASALTIDIKTQAGTDPTAADIIYLGMRNPTITTGNYNLRSIIAALSLVVPSGATLGTSSGVEDYLYLYALDNAGTIELGIINGTLDEGEVHSSTAMTTGSDSAATLYSTSARSNVAVRLIGRIRITEATAGAWVSNATSLSVLPFQLI